jgi:Tfp pilus assembly PilM family ATPase
MAEESLEERLRSSLQPEEERREERREEAPPLVEKILERRPCKRFGRGYISLSLEGANLRLLCFSQDGIEGWTSLPFNPRFLKGGFVSQPEGLGKVIASLLTSWNLRGYLLCSFPGLGTLLRTLSIPLVKGVDLSTLVPREARRQFSFSPETHFLFWEAFPGRATAQVYAVIVPKEPLLNLIAALEAAGRKPHRIELKSLALLHLLGERDGVIVHSELNCFELMVVQGGLPTFMRTIFLGDEILPQETVVGRLIEEVSNSIFYYNETYRDSPLDPATPIYLSGSLAETPGLAENLSSFSGHRIAPLEPPFPYPLEFPLSHFLVNIGLILGAKKR